MIDNPQVDWNPFTNAMRPAPPDTIRPGAPDRPGTDSGREPDTRYAKLLASFAASREADPFCPSAPTAIERAFQQGAEMPEKRVRALLIQVLESPLGARVAARIRERLGRDLLPQDLWYSGFMSRGTLPEEQLDAITRERYPTAEAFQNDLPRMLEQLGFSPDRARFLADHIVVDASRGSGHAMPAGRRGDRPRLRTRVERGGMDYKGYNIAIHELGHNVEQVFSLYAVDRTLLAGVPNTAFTEAFAFIFQSRDLELLGIAGREDRDTGEHALSEFWIAREMAGVALMDIEVWHWMYAHPDTTPDQLREATVQIARDLWNRYYASLLSARDCVLLACYQHMLAHPLYLFNYGLGRMITAQIEEQIQRAGSIGPEFERMASYGSVLPDLWMKHATGSEVSADALLRATERALAG